ncbi:LysR family transcriptional regulator [Aureimonas altamirensis]|uniref:LysR family transcriptional regulator n=1 Tax=Aureimonas altamirensis TaxID=370622 RepID=UPI0020367631|nr:LysR family transcriptional regulator [Aureimonas altamirensis]MCM2503474.1 LysR family transcriptional regulator [Aureimonas altamirensis]
MDIRWLYDFLMLVETGSFTRAAELRNSSQAAFSRRIQSLENQLKSPLIDRGTYPFELTDAGRRFRTRLIEILPQLRSAMLDVSDERPTGLLRISLPFALAIRHIGRWTSQWADERMRFSIEPGDTHAMFTALVSGETDVLINWHSPAHPIIIDSERFMRLKVGSERVRPFARRDLRDKIAWPGSERAPMPILAYRKGVFFSRLVDTIETQAPTKLHGNIVAESHMADILRDLASAGLGVAWLPASTVDRDPELVPLDDDGAWSLDVDIVALADKRSENPLTLRLMQRLESGGPLVFSSPSPSLRNEKAMT